MSSKAELLATTRTVVDAVLAQTLRGQQYDDAKVSGWNATIAKEVIEKLKDVSRDEFKFCVSSVIIRQAGDGAAQGLALKSHTSALGDPDTDGHVSINYETESLLCVCMCHMVAGKTNNEGGFWTYLKPSTYLEPLVAPIVGPPPPVAPPVSSDAGGSDSNSMIGSLAIPFMSLTTPSGAESPSERSCEETKSPAANNSSMKQRGAKFPKTAQRDTGCLNCFPSESRDDATDVPEDPTVVHTRHPQQQEQQQQPQKQSQIHIPVPESPLFDRPQSTPTKSVVAGATPTGSAGGNGAVAPGLSIPTGLWPPSPPMPHPPQGPRPPRSPTPSVGSALDLKERSPGVVDVTRTENVKAVNALLRGMAEDSALQVRHWHWHWSGSGTSPGRSITCRNP